MRRSVVFLALAVSAMSFLPPFAIQSSAGNDVVRMVGEITARDVNLSLAAAPLSNRRNTSSPRG
jgi:hypothetical protein